MTWLVAPQSTLRVAWMNRLKIFVLDFPDARLESRRGKRLDA